MATVQLVEPGAAVRDGLVTIGEEPARVPFWAWTALPATRPLTFEQVRLWYSWSPNASQHRQVVSLKSHLASVKPC